MAFFNSEYIRLLKLSVTLCPCHFTVFWYFGKQSCRRRCHLNSQLLGMAIKAQTTRSGNDSAGSIHHNDKPAAFSTSLQNKVPSILINQTFDSYMFSSNHGESNKGTVQGIYLSRKSTYTGNLHTITQYDQRECLKLQRIYLSWAALR